MNTTEIEKTLRGAPVPKAPPGLKAQLLQGAPKQAIINIRGRDAAGSWVASWLQRWWPALVPAAASLAFATMISSQQMEIKKLQATIAQQTKAGNSVPSSAVVEPGASTGDPAVANPADEESEIARLKGEVDRLNAEIQRLEQLKARNEALKHQVTAANGLTVQEAQALSEQRDRALTMVCINNMKQIGLAVRMWASNHGETAPSQVLDMTNELVTPKILVCPADSARQTATNWAAIASAGSSYDFLAAGASTQEPTRVMFRCPIHGNIGLVDGSVQKGVAKTHPEWLVQRQGVLFMDQNAQTR